MRGLAGLIVLLSALEGAVAADILDARPANFESSHTLKPFVFDIEDGKYKAQNVPVDCGTNAIFLKSHFTRLGEAKTKWVPLMSLGFESASTRTMAQIISRDFQPPLRVVITKVNLKDKSDTESVELYNTFDLETPVPVLASWSPDGLVTFNVGSETRTVNLQGPVLQAVLIASTGAGIFDPLETGRLKGTDPAASCPKLTP